MKLNARKEAGPKEECFKSTDLGLGIWGSESRLQAARRQNRLQTA